MKTSVSTLMCLTSSSILSSHTDMASAIAFNVFTYSERLHPTPKLNNFSNIHKLTANWLSPHLWVPSKSEIQECPGELLEPKLATGHYLLLLEKQELQNPHTQHVPRALAVVSSCTTSKCISNLEETTKVFIYAMLNESIHVTWPEYKTDIY